MPSKVACTTCNFSIGLKLYVVYGLWVSAKKKKNFFFDAYTEDQQVDHHETAKEV